MYNSTGEFLDATLHRILSSLEIKVIKYDWGLEYHVVDALIFSQAWKNRSLLPDVVDGEHHTDRQDDYINAGGSDGNTDESLTEQRPLLGGP